MKNIKYLFFGLISLLMIQACQNEHGKNYNDATRIDEDGLNFIKNGIELGMTVTKASGLAITNSNNQRVISLAKMMIKDHAAIDSTFKKLEKERAIIGHDTISGNHESIISGLSKKRGLHFDMEYITRMVADNEVSLQLFKIGSGNTDVKVSKFAAKTLPVIQMQLDSAKAVLTSLL